MYGTLLIRIATLVHEIDPSLEEPVPAGFILSPIAPAALDLRGGLGVRQRCFKHARALVKGLAPGDEP